MTAEPGKSASAPCGYDRWGACQHAPIWRVSTIADGYDDAIERALACARHLNVILQGLTDYDEFVLDRLTGAAENVPYPPSEETP